MKGISPMQRTLKELRKRGYICGITEKFNSFIKIRQDLFGFIDLIAIKSGEIIGVQCTSGAHHADHKTKIISLPYASAWLNAGGKIQLWTWSKHKIKRGGKAEQWVARMEEITLIECSNVVSKPQIQKT